MGNPLEDRAEYIRETFTQEDAVLKDVLERTAANTDLIQVRPEEAKLLQFLIRSCGIKKVVEIGTLAGYSAIWMARALPEDGHVFTIEHDPMHAELAAESFKNSDVADKITLLGGPGQEMLDGLTDAEAPVDMVFIDADKSLYLDFLDWAEENVRKGGLIVGDNTFLFDAVFSKTPPERVRPETIRTMREFNSRLADPKRYCSTMIPSKQGITVALKLF